MIGLSLSPTSTFAFHSKTTPRTPISTTTTTTTTTAAVNSNLNKSSFNGVHIFQFCRTPLSSASITRRGSSFVVMMAKREEELQGIREKTTEEINEEIIDLKGELFMLRLQRAARNEYKSSEFRRMRKKIARLQTVRREREIQEGIGTRLSRKLDRKWRKSIVVRPPPSLKKLQEEDADGSSSASA